jgi:hypothetical protein
MSLSINAFLLGVVAIAGLFLLASGLRRRRRGETPRCGRCEYELTGLEAPERCPECGAELGDGADGKHASRVVYGERYRRPVVAITGAAVLLLLGVPLAKELVDQGRRYDWFRLRPTVWLLDDLVTGPQSVRAAQELNRRYEAGSLPRGSEKLDRFASQALADQAKPGGPGQLLQEQVSFLSRAVTRGDLSAEHAKRFYQNAVLLTLAAPATATPGAHVPVRINETCRVQNAGLMVQISHLRLGWDGEMDPRVSDADGTRGGYSRLSGVGAGGSTGTSIKAPANPGEHVLNVTARVTVYTGSMDDHSAKVLEQHDVELKATLNVRADASSAP